MNRPYLKLLKLHHMAWLLVWKLSSEIRNYAFKKALKIGDRRIAAMMFENSKLSGEKWHIVLRDAKFPRS